MKQPTASQKQASEERRAMMRELARSISAMTEEQKRALIERVGTISTVESHPLTLHNALMVISQCADGTTPSLVGGFNQWRNAGRMVRKGEHGLAIFVPLAPPKAEDGEATDEKMRFKLAYVFDISQTDELSAASA